MTDIRLKKSQTGGIRRRDFLATGAATLALGVTGFPAVLRAQAEPVKIGLIHPVSGFIAFSGTQCRAGAEMAITGETSRWRVVADNGNEKTHVFCPTCGAPVYLSFR